MLKRHNQLRNTFLRILDLLIAFSAWELAYLLRFPIIDWPPAIEIPSHQEYLKAAVVVVILTLMVFVHLSLNMFHLYWIFAFRSCLVAIVADLQLCRFY